METELITVHIHTNFQGTVLAIFKDENFVSNHKIHKNYIPQKLVHIWYSLTLRGLKPSKNHLWDFEIFKF